jgi:hypothetical protein
LPPSAPVHRTTVRHGSVFPIRLEHVGGSRPGASSVSSEIETVRFAFAAAATGVFAWRPRAPSSSRNKIPGTSCADTVDAREGAWSATPIAGSYPKRLMRSMLVCTGGHNPWLGSVDMDPHSSRLLRARGRQGSPRADARIDHYPRLALPMRS